MLEFTNLNCSYGKNEILKNINFKLEKDSIVSILGANGSGKSTFLKALMGINNYGGKISYNGKNLDTFSIKERAKVFAYVPQQINIPFEFNVLDVVLMGRFHGSASGFNYKKEDYEKVDIALSKVGALKFKDKVFKYLSGGEKQLVFLARALVQDSKIIVLDEPTTGLDLGNQMKILELMHKLKQDGKTIIQTTHYPDHALRVSDKVVWLHKKNLLAFGDAKSVVTKDRVAEVYGVDSMFLEHENRYRFLLPLELITKEKYEK